VRALRPARDGDLPALIVAARDCSAEVRAAAAQAFARAGGPAAADALGALVADPDPAVSAAAARGLGGMPQEPRARDALLRSYGRAGAAGRDAVATALDALGVSLRDAVEAEARALWERNLAALSGDAAARAGAAEEIGASGRAAAVQRLVPLLDPARNADPALAAAASRGLGEAGDRSARAALEGVLAHGDASLAESAAAALARLGDPASADALAEASLGPTRIASAAVDALAALPSANVVGAALCAVAARATDPSVAARAARSAAEREAGCPERPLLARLGTPAAQAALAALGELPAPSREAAERAVRLLQAPRSDAGVRVAAVRLAARAGWAPAGAILLRRATALGAREDAAADDVDAAELAALAAAVGRLHADGAAPLLGRLARDPRAPVRAGAVEGFALLDAPASGPALEAALGDADLQVRCAAAEGLVHRGARGVVALRAAAASAAAAEPAWRAALARALGDTGSPDAIPALAPLLDGDSAPAAAAALARTASPGAAAPLVAYLGRREASARADAIDALAQLGAREAAPVIAARLTDDRPEIRAAAARALGKLRHEPSAARLEALRSDYYGRVRRAAVEALAKLPAGARPRR
jgi:HEAT repeat protein